MDLKSQQIESFGAKASVVIIKSFFFGIFETAVEPHSCFSVGVP